MADHPQAMADLRSLLATREPLYALADHTVDTSSVSANDVIEVLDRQLT
jgi:hypothetical protein